MDVKTPPRKAAPRVLSYAGMGVSRNRQKPKELGKLAK